MSDRTDLETKPWIGALGGLTAVVIWSGWISATRFAVTEQVDPLILALCRAGLPSLILAPVIWRRGIVPRGAPIGAVLLMALGWGAPFLLLVSQGLATIPASMFGPLVPGLAPILVALLAWAILGARPGRQLIGGLVLIGGAMALILGQWLAEGNWAALGGAPYLIAACFGISLFTVMTRLSGLSPLEAAAYISFYSLPMLAVWAVLNPEPLAEPTLAEWGWHLLTQGLATGIVAVLAYGMAIRHLGPVRGGSVNALVPVAAALVGVSVLGETMTPLDWMAVVAASVGVAVVNGMFSRRRI